MRQDGALAMRHRRWSMWAGVAIVLAGAAMQAQAADLAAELATPQAPLPPAKAPAFVPDPGKPWWRFFTDGEWYFEFGSNKEFWSNPDIQVSQPALGNNFTIYDVKGHDSPAGAGEAPQYNIRVGRFFNENWGVELNIDHSKYSTDIGQTAQVSGLIAACRSAGPASWTISSSTSNCTTAPTTSCSTRCIAIR